MRVAFHLQGKTGFLFHADDVMASDRLSAWRSDPANKNLSVKGDDRSPPWTYQEYLYLDDQGLLCIPFENMMVCLRQAGAQVILNKQKTMKEITQSGLSIPDEFISFFAGGKRIDKANFDRMRDKVFSDQCAVVRKFSPGSHLFVKRARIGTAKHVRVRLRVNDWEAKGVLDVLVPEITWDRLETLFVLAGRIGMGDWRPGCKTPGCFGQFTSTIRKVKDNWTWEDDSDS